MRQMLRVKPCAMHFVFDRNMRVTPPSGAGEMTMTHLPGRVSQWEGAQIMLKADAGKIMEVQKLAVHKIAAFILEPVSKGGCG